MKKSIISIIFDLKLNCLAKEEKIINTLKLSPAEYRAILSLVPGSEVPCSILSKKMGLSVSRGSRVIDKLLQNGYLHELKSKKDQRITNVELTQKGAKIQRKIHNILEDCEHMILKSMSAPELESLANSLTKISEVLIKK